MITVAWKTEVKLPGSEEVLRCASEVSFLNEFIVRDFVRFDGIFFQCCSVRKIDMNAPIEIILKSLKLIKRLK